MGGAISDFEYVYNECAFLSNGSLLIFFEKFLYESLCEMNEFLSVESKFYWMLNFIFWCNYADSISRIDVQIYFFFP